MLVDRKVFFSSILAAGREVKVAFGSTDAVVRQDESEDFTETKPVPVLCGV
jgi:hypothetical protein